MSQSHRKFGSIPFWRKILIWTLIITFLLTINPAVYAEDMVSIPASPSLAADLTDNNVDNSLQITFADDPAWASAITAIYVNNNPLNASGYSVAPGTITINQGFRTVPGDYSIVVQAAGYADSVCNQQLQAGSANAAQSTITQIIGPAVNGGLLAAQPVVTLKDQYGNQCTTGPSSGSAVTAEVTFSGCWTLGGTTRVNAVNGIASFSDLTARNIMIYELSNINMKFSFGGQQKDSNGFSIPLTSTTPQPPPPNPPTEPNPPAADVTAPTWVDGYPRSVSISTSGFSLLLKSNEHGNAYYVVLADNAAPPAVFEVRAGTGKGGVTPIAMGNMAISANIEGTVNIAGLSAATGYDIYVVAADTSNNLQAQPYKGDVLTATSTNSDANPTTPLTLTFYPANAAAGVSNTVMPSIVFNKSVTNENGSEINSSNAASLISLKRGSASGSDVAAAVTINPEKNRILVTPATALDSNQLYYFALLKTVKSEDGGSVVAQSVTFITATSTTSTTSCKLNDLQVNGATISGFNSNIFEYTVGVNAASVPQVNAIALDKAAVVEVTQATKVPGQAIVKVFGTSQQTYTISFTAAVTGPEVEATDPSPGATGAETTQPVSLKFTRNIVLGDKASEICITNGSSKVIPNKTIIESVLILAPATVFSPYTTYTLKIPAGSIKDTDGNPIAADYTMSFTTGAAAVDDYSPIVINQIQTISVTSIKLDKHSLALTAGGNNAALNITILPNNATNASVSWRSDNENVVKVVNGVVTPVGKGTALITVITNDGGMSDNCSVTVNPSGVTTQTSAVQVMEALQIAPEPLIQKPVLSFVNSIFKDLAGTQAAPAINNLVTRGIISGYPDGTFRPNQSISRLDLLVLVSKAAGIKPDYKGLLKFPDAKLIPAWAKGYVTSAVKYGIVPPSWNGRLAPGAKATRAEIVYTVGRALKAKVGTRIKLVFRDNVPNWAAGYISWAVVNKIIAGYSDNTFRPLKPVSRAEVCIILSRAFLK